MSRASPSTMKLATDSNLDLREWKKYKKYYIRVDPDQDDKACEIRIFSLRRPHMRAFHASWLSFFVAFFIWFAISPLLGEIRDTLGLTNQEIWTSSITGVGGTFFVRLVMGPLCDKYGARLLFSMVLVAASIPTACVGFVNTSMGLSVLRLFIGIAGGSFVVCQFWTSRMFTNEVVGFANALVAGWGNLGGGVTQILMGSALFPLFKIYFNGDSELAWRTVCLVPAFVAFCTGVSLICLTDDAPKGNYHELKASGGIVDVSITSSFCSGIFKVTTWLLFIQYACCFGVELTVNNAASLYFRDVFGQSTENAAAIASIFGWMNLFARGIGGYLSDWANARWSMRGRLWVQAVLLLLEGAMVLVFAHTGSLVASIVAMTIFSLFVQASEGATFGIVPFVEPESMGSITGIVGAGGSFGAVVFSTGFRQLPYQQAFTLMGSLVMVSSLLTVFVKIKGYAGMIWDEDVRMRDEESQKTDDEEANLKADDLA